MVRWVTALSLLLLVCASAIGSPGQYIVVLKPGAGAEPDFKALGAGEEHRWRDRVHIRINDQAALTALLAHPRVAYMQEMFASGGSGPSVAGAAAVAPLSGGTVGFWSSGDFDYDGALNIVKIGSDTYTYDVLGRIVRAGVVSGEATTTDVYAYDAFANLYSRTTTGTTGTSVMTNAVASSSNRFIDASYDSVGNTLTLTTFPAAGSYRWDSVRMMSGLTAPGRNDEFIYTASGQRLASVKNDGTWKWTFRDFGGRTIREMESSGPSWLWIEDVVYRDKQIAATERPVAQGGRRHFHNDHLGTARLITSHAGQGVSRHDYLPFGIELSSIRQEQDRGAARENAYRFTGHERDFIGGTVTENTISLDYMIARHYSSMLGRFLTIDPGRDWKLSDSQSWNLYAYVQNNPISNVDMNGKWKTHIHNYLIDKAFPGLSNAQRHVLKRASASVDFFLTAHTPGRSPQHAMRSRSQTVGEAQAQSAAFYDQKIGDAREKLSESKASAGDGTGRSEALAMGALFNVGEAMHMVSDSGSPSHSGHKEWDPIFDPIISIFEHGDAEKEIDAATEALIILQLQSIFGTVFGEEEQERATGQLTGTGPAN
jgi:RHS repeat-associated protein